MIPRGQSRPSESASPLSPTWSGTDTRRRGSGTRKRHCRPSDRQRGFIKARSARTTTWGGGAMAGAKAAGNVRMEGKDYVMEDDDVVEFCSNV